MPVFTFTIKSTAASEREGIAKENPRKFLAWIADRYAGNPLRVRPVLQFRYYGQLYVDAAGYHPIFSERYPLNVLYQVDDASFADYEFTDWPDEVWPIVTPGGEPESFTVDTADLLDVRPLIRTQALLMRNLDHEIDHDFRSIISAIDNMRQFLVEGHPERAAELGSVADAIVELKERNVYFSLSGRLVNALIGLTGFGVFDVETTAAQAMTLGRTLMDRYYEWHITHDDFRVTLREGQTRDTAGRFVRDVEAIPIVFRRPVTEDIVDAEVAKIVAARESAA